MSDNEVTSDNAAPVRGMFLLSGLPSPHTEAGTLQMTSRGLVAHANELPASEVTS